MKTKVNVFSVTSLALIAVAFLIGAVSHMKSLSPENPVTMLLHHLKNLGQIWTRPSNLTTNSILSALLGAYFLLGKFAHNNRLKFHCLLVTFSQWANVLIMNVPSIQQWNDWPVQVFLAFLTGLAVLGLFAIHWFTTPQNSN